VSEAVEGVAGVARINNQKHHELVILAASAGGLVALRTILAALPADFPLPVAVLQHRSSTVPSILPVLLSRVSALAVKEAEAGERFRPGIVYVAPATAHLIVGQDRCFHLQDGMNINFLRSAADPLIRSAAHSLGGNVIAVILTGGGRNGTSAVRDVGALGGTVIAQDPATALHAAMPRAAIATGAVDYVLPLEEIGPMLVRLANAEPNDDRADTRAV
jgi:two-component system chemotaxis response regulator CheB